MSDPRQQCPKHSRTSRAICLVNKHWINQPCPLQSFPLHQGQENTTPSCLLTRSLLVLVKSEFSGRAERRYISEWLLSSSQDRSVLCGFQMSCTGAATMGRGGGYRDLGCVGETGPSQAGLGQNILFLPFLSLLPSTLASSPSSPTIVTLELQEGNWISSKTVRSILLFTKYFTFLLLLSFEC